MITPVYDSLSPEPMQGLSPAKVEADCAQHAERHRHSDRIPRARIKPSSVDSLAAACSQIAFGPIDSKGTGRENSLLAGQARHRRQAVEQTPGQTGPRCPRRRRRRQERRAYKASRPLERVLFDQADALVTEDGSFRLQSGTSHRRCIKATWPMTFSMHGKSSQAGHLSLYTEAGDGNDAYYDASRRDDRSVQHRFAANLDNIIANKLERPLGQVTRKGQAQTCRGLAKRSLAPEHRRQSGDDQGALHRTWRSPRLPLG